MVYRDPNAAQLPPPLTLARWLAWPFCFVSAHWFLAVKPDVPKAVIPALWTTGGNGTVDVLPPMPTTRAQTFDLGWHSRYFQENCPTEEGARAAWFSKCSETLQAAGDVLGLARPLTAIELVKMRPYLVELDAQRSLTDRVMGFFSFVNIMWLVAVLGIIGTVGPALAFLVGPMMLKLGQKLLENVILPVAEFLERNGFVEAGVYVFAYALSVQGLRYPSSQDHAAMMVSFTGGLLFAPCWGYSTVRHIKEKSDDSSKFLMLTNMLIAATLGPLAVLHDSRLIGFFTVMAVYAALGFVFFCFGFGYAVGFDGSDAAMRCVVASVILVVTFVSLRIAGVDASILRPFSTGAMVLGNVMYFLALLIYTGPFRRHSTGYVLRNAVMAASLLAALVVGNVFGLQSMSNTAAVFMVLWIMEKEMEVNWGGSGIVVLFLNFVAMYYIAHFLHTHPEFVLAMFDPKGLYIS